MEVLARELVRKRKKKYPNLKRKNISVHSWHNLLCENSWKICCCFFLFLPHCSIWKFLGQVSNLSHSYSNTRSLTYCAGPGIKPMPPQRQCQIVYHSRNCKKIVLIVRSKKFSIVTWLKNKNTQKSVEFLFTNNKLSKKEVKETIQFIIALK